jgi:hypothetical protein
VNRLTDYIGDLFEYTGVAWATRLATVAVDGIRHRRNRYFAGFCDFFYGTATTKPAFKRVPDF